MSDHRYENPYRDYLDDQTFYRQYLKNHEDGPGFISSHKDALLGIGLFAGTLMAYRRGWLRPVMERLIQTIGGMRRGYISAAAQGLRAFSEDEIWEKSQIPLTGFPRDLDGLLKSFRSSFKSAFDKHHERMELLKGSPLVTRDSENRVLFTELTKSLQEHVRALNKLQKNAKNRPELSGAALNRQLIQLRREMVKALQERYHIRPDEDLRRIRQTGHRLAKVKEVVQHLSPHEQEILSTFRQTFKDEFNLDIWNWAADPHIMIHESGKIADLREFYHSISRFTESASNDFGLPFVKFNPLKLLYLDRILTTHKPPLFQYFSKGSTIQPNITGNIRSIARDMMFINGNVWEIHETGAIQKIADNVFLAPAKSGLLARVWRNLAGIQVKTFKPPEKGFWNKVRYKIADTLSLGMQDAPIRPYSDDGRVPFEFYSPTDWISKMAEWMDKKFPIVPRESRPERYKRFSEVFGEDTQWLMLRRYRSLRDMNGNPFEWGKQFFASRRRMQEATFAGVFGYTLFERLNEALNSTGLGLMSRDLGSGFEIMKNLTLKRLLPLWLGIETFKYINYLSGDDQDPDHPPLSHRIADAYKNISIWLAKVRDKLGLTKMAKDWSKVFPGGDQITEFPFIGHFFKWDQSEEETRKFWDEGVVPVRKGRFWDLGNTPFTGGKIDYYKPNWVREWKADIPYSDVMYGSREEYWKYAALPTFQYPLAPVRHFITEPYHFEEKHYWDRPYPETGPIPELQAVPLIGPLVGGPVSQILKPTKPMHQEDLQSQQDLETVGEELYAFEGRPVLGEHDGQNLARARDAIQRAYVTQRREAVSPQDRDGRQTIVYTTSSGEMQLLSVPKKISIQQLNEAIRSAGIQRTGYARTIREEDVSSDVAKVYDDPSKILDPYSWQMIAGNLHYNLAEIGGIYGFGSVMLTGELFDQQPVIQDSSRAYSFERAFWDRDIGGLGGEANEIFRRFLPHRRHQIQEVNPIRNTMPSWMPGSDYYLDFQHGDPYIKVKRGEERLPGEAYERLWHVDANKEMYVEAAKVGLDKQGIMDHLLHRDELMQQEPPPHLQVREYQNIYKELAEQGILIQGRGHFEDPVHRIRGFYDGLVVDEEMAKANHLRGGEKEPAVLSIEAVNDKQFHQSPQTTHIAQLNYYIQQMGTKAGYLMYVDTDTGQRRVWRYTFNPKLYLHDMQEIDEARKEIRREIQERILGPADLYPLIDRLRILADVAPYSDEYRSLRDQISKMDLSDAERREIQEIRHRVAEQKKFTRMYPYQTLYTEVEQKQVHVTKVLDNNTFLTREYPDHPIKLSGIYVPTGKDDPAAQAARDLISEYVHPGATIHILVNQDPLQFISKDTYQTIPAVVMEGHGRNLNQALLRKGLAKERESDNTSTGIYARYTPLQRKIGRWWESFVHTDDPIMTKFLQVRSPAESYERREVWGKDFQTWDHPIQSFLEPLFWKLIHGASNAGIMGSTFYGAMIGVLFGQTRYGRMVGGITGGLIGAVLGTFGSLYRATHHEEWIPKSRRKEWDINEYIDVLKYVKYERLYQHYADLAQKREHFDVRQYIQETVEKGKERKREIHQLEALKRAMHTASNKKEKRHIALQIRKALKYRGPDGKEYESLIHALNDRIQELASYREIHRIGPNAERALFYYQAKKKTMYGYERGDPLENILAALPKKDREYLLPFIESPRKERRKILEETPPYFRRVIEGSWGLTPEEKPDLEEYFRHHELPDPTWIGWDPRVNLNDVKIKLVQNEALDRSEFDIWPEDERRARHENISPPRLYTHETYKDVHAKLLGLLGEHGLEDLDVQVIPNQSGEITVDMEIHRDNREKIMDYIKNQPQAIFG